MSKPNDTLPDLLRLTFHAPDWVLRREPSPGSATAKSRGCTCPRQIYVPNAIIDRLSIATCCPRHADEFPEAQRLREANRTHFRASRVTNTQYHDILRVFPDLAPDDP